MVWQDEWRALAARIEAQMAAGSLLVQVLQKNNDDPNNTVGTLISQITDTNRCLKAFADRYRAALPLPVGKAIDAHCANAGNVNNAPGNPLMKLSPWLVRVQCLRSEVDYLLSDFRVVMRRRSERAFLHLQQCIAAAGDVRDRWQAAYGEGETACERLGGAHLLQHGIYAFKANGEGARTDLVFAEPVDGDGAARVADALVLTEWKLVREPAEAEAKARQARDQACLYRTGVLGGIELDGYRYVVLVSRERLGVMPGDIVEGGVTTRHVNIAVAPSAPSRAALA